MWTKEIVRNVKNAIHGWKLYFTHPVFSAGLALASIFMTVLGVDNITYGFCMAQCIQKSILGGLLGLTAIVGILGSLTFPVLRKRFGLHMTGLVHTNPGNIFSQFGGNVFPMCSVPFNARFEKNLFERLFSKHKENIEVLSCLF